MIGKHALTLAMLAALAAPPLAAAQESTAPVSPAGGFYGGVALRNTGTQGPGVDLGHVAATWGRYVSPVSDDTARRALVFGGYRWANDVALEGSFSTADRYALRPSDAAAARGVGLSLNTTSGLSPHVWNADVYTSWAFRKSFACTGAWAMHKPMACPRTRLQRCRPPNLAVFARASITAWGCATTSRRHSACASSMRGSAGLPESRSPVPCPTPTRCSWECSSGSDRKRPSYNRGAGFVREDRRFCF